MLAYYYQTTKNKINNEAEISNYYNDILKINSTVQNLSSACRVCLKEGNLTSINSQSNSKQLIEALKVFGNIDVNPKNANILFCSICLKFIKTAISFCQVARRSDEIFKTYVKEVKVKTELIETFDNHDDDLPLSCIREIPEKKQQDAISKKSDHIPSKEANKKLGKPEEKIYKTTKVSCPQCGKIVTKSALKQHMLLHDPNKKKYVCHICGKTFSLPMSFRRHSLTHGTDFPYKCKLCPYRGQLAELLRSHMRSHTHDYRYMCTECPARFLHISNMNRHMRTHKEPQFKCDTCKKSFHTKLIMERHIELVHLGIKNHFCSICDKAFGTRKAIRNHERGVHKQKKVSYRRMPLYLKAENMTKNST